MKNRRLRMLARLFREHRSALFVVAVITLMVWPVSAHAGLGDDIVAGVNRMIAAIPDIFLGILGTAIGAVGKSITIIVTLPLAADNAVVRGVWLLLRNVCNMVFLLALIIMAFATVFQVPFGKFRAYAFQSAFQYFLIAAIFLNFSMALGVLLVRGTDLVNTLIVRIMPQDIGNQISSQLNAYSNLLPSSNTPEGKAADASTDKAVQIAYEDCQKLYGTGGPENLKSLQQCRLTAVATTQRGQALQKCYQNYPCVAQPNGTCFPPKEQITCTASIAQIPQGGCLQLTGKAAGASGQGICFTDEKPLLVSGRNLNWGIIGWYYTKAYVANPLDFGKALQIFVVGMFNVLLLLVLLASLLTALVFLVVRIPFIWVLLAISPLAYTAYAFPGGREQLTKWWKALFGWCVFSPMYLLVVYVGMILLSNQYQLLASLQAQGGSGATQFISTIIFYGMAAFAFIGGAFVSIKGSFAMAGLAETGAARLAGGIAGYTGVGGLEEWQRALGAGVTKRREEVGEAIKARLPGPLRPVPYAEKEAAVERFLRIRGTTEKRVGGERKKLDEQIRVGNMGNDAAKALTRNLITTGNRDQQRAARELRIDKGWASQSEARQYVNSFTAGTVESAAAKERLAKMYAAEKPPKDAFTDKAAIQRTLGMVSMERRGDVLKAAAKANPHNTFQVRSEELETRTRQNAQKLNQPVDEAKLRKSKQELMGEVYRSALEEPKVFAKLDDSYFKDAEKKAAMVEALKQKNMHGSQFGEMDKNQQRAFMKFVNSATNESPTRSGEIHDLMGMLRGEFREIQEQMRTGKEVHRIERVQDLSALTRARKAESDRASRLETNVRQLTDAVRQSANNPQQLGARQRALDNMTRNLENATKNLSNLDRQIAAAQTQTAQQGPAQAPPAPKPPSRPRNP